jgi:AraC-like DNA-binding protein
MDIQAATMRIVIAHRVPAVASGLAAWIRERSTWKVTLCSPSEATRLDALIGKHVVVMDESLLIPSPCTPTTTLGRLPWTRLLVISEQRGVRHASAAKDWDACLPATCEPEALMQAVTDLVQTLCSGSEDACADGEPFDDPGQRASTRCPRRLKVRGGLSPHNQRRVRAYILERATENTGVPELAAISGLSRDHFARVFKESFGVSPYRYIMLNRIRAAAEYLLRTDLPVGDVAIAFGFAPGKAFARMFSAIVGEAPRQFRHRHRPAAKALTSDHPEVSALCDPASANDGLQRGVLRGSRSAPSSR